MAYCSRCDRVFPNFRALDQHCQASSAHHVCSDCDVDFTSRLGLKEHWVQSPSHHYCQYDDTHFGSSRDLDMHWRNDHWFCRMHRKVFENESASKKHFVQSRDHHYCGRCNQHFGDEDIFNDHIDSSHYACMPCRKMFDTEAKQQEHFTKNHYHCSPCDRFFQSQANLDSHLASSTHRPRNVVCPGRGCSRAFVSVSAMMLHFESGTCPSGLTRQELNRLVVRADRNNAITNPQRLLTGPDGPRAPPVTTTWASARSWNGSAFECFLCYRTFGTLPALNSHLESPKHEEKIYICPQSSCRTEFRTLSSLCQHVENGSCGVRRFREVQNTINGLVSGMRGITF